MCISLDIIDEDCDRARRMISHLALSPRRFPKKRERQWCLPSVSTPFKYYRYLRRYLRMRRPRIPTVKVCTTTLGTSTFTPFTYSHFTPWNCALLSTGVNEFLQMISHQKSKKPQKQCQTPTKVAGLYIVCCRTHKCSGTDRSLPPLDSHYSGRGFVPGVPGAIQ